MSWHLTIGETAFFAPAGVILGAFVSYRAVRRSAADNLKAQEQTIEANREIAQQSFEHARKLADDARAADAVRGRRAQQVDAYRDGAIRIEELQARVKQQIQYLEWLREWKKDDIASDLRQTQLRGEFEGFWSFLIDNSMEIRRLLLATASDELNHLRYFLVTTQDVFGDFSYTTDLLTEYLPKKWVSEYDSSSGVLIARMREGRFDRAQVVDSYLAQYRTLQDILVWAIRQIRFELGVSEKPADRQYSGYDPRREPYLG
jgi:hypothetical protein